MMEEKTVERLAGFINPETFEDDIASVLRMLRETDWEPLIRASATNRHQRTKMQFDDLNNRIVQCFRCRRDMRLGDEVHLDREYREFSSCCPECADEVRVEYRRICGVCGSVFVAPAKGAVSLVCGNCRTPTTISEERRVKKNCERTTELGLPSTLTLAEWLQTVADFHGMCAYCQVASIEDMEHFIPVQSGGGTTVNNCVPACSTCNARKNKRNPDDAMLLRFFPNDEIERVRLYLASRR